MEIDLDTIVHKDDLSKLRKLMTMANYTYTKKMVYKPRLLRGVLTDYLTSSFFIDIDTLVQELQDDIKETSTKTYKFKDSRISFLKDIIKQLEDKNGTS